MEKYTNNTLAEPMDAVIITDGNYEQYGLKTGYVGVVVENLIEERNFVLVDFFDPFSGKDIYVQAKIKKEDFRVLTPTAKDRALVKAYKDLFR